jgi:hypothetical protein
MGNYSNIGDGIIAVFYFMIGVIIAAALWGAYSTYQWVTADDYQTLIDQCGSQLPRDKHCKLIAVPEGE